jgi:hypothetical protein
MIGEEPDHQNVWRNTALAKTTSYFKKKVKKFKSFEFPPQLSLKNFIQYSS